MTRNPAGGCTLASVLALQPLLLAVLSAWPEPAAAQRVVHRVRFGETFASVAAHYYGRKEYARFIELTNGRTGESLEAGERIRVPTAWVYVVPKTTTLSKLAARLLGDRRRADPLADFNRTLRQRTVRVRAGTELVVPFTIDHRVSPGETFASISATYYGNAAQAGLIAQYNFMRGNQPPAATSLEIPIAHVRVTPARLASLTNYHVLGVSPERQQEDRAALQEANGMLRRGDYWRVPLRLVRLLAREQPSDVYIAEVFKLLAIAYVALNQHKLATDAFQEALLRQPSLSLDPVTHSPKVIRAFTDGRGLERAP